MPSLIASSSSPLLFVMALLPTFAWQGVSFRIGLDRKACNMVVDEVFSFLDLLHEFVKGLRGH